MTSSDSSEDGNRSTVERIRFDRRTLLGGALAGVLGIGGGAYLYGNGPGPNPVDNDENGDAEEPPTVPDDHVPFSVWREQRAAVRTSPDHLPARVTELTEEGDVEGIFEFVRDEIATVPTGYNDFEDPMSSVRWGPRGALRSGTGTPRDKVELLVKLYREAGYESELLEAREPMRRFGLNDKERFIDLICRPIDNPYDPDIDHETIDDWRTRLEADESTTLEFVDRDGEAAEALAEQVRTALPEDAAEDPRGFRWHWETNRRHSDASIPIASVTDEAGTRRLANLFLDLPFDRIVPDEELEDEVREGLEPAAEPTPQTVEVSLSAATASDLLAEEPFELVRGEWTGPELIGRQLRVRFSPLVDPFSVPEMSVNNVDAFTPALTVQGSDIEPEELAELSVFGDLVTLTGHQLSTDYDIEDGELITDGTVTRNGEPVYDLADSVDPALVTDLELSVDASEYPRIELQATPMDDSGDAVPGLVGPIFSTTDDGERVMPTMVRNASNPRILFIRDTSTSMRSARGDLGSIPYEDEWYEDMVARLDEAAPDVEIEIREVDSRMWTHLTQGVVDSRAGVEGYDLIVYAHDGRSHDDFADPMTPILTDAPPTVLISAYDGEEPVETDTILEQADIVDGDAVPMGETDLVEQTILRNLREDVTITPYRFEYYAPSGATGERTVELSLGEEPDTDPVTQAEATYTIDQTQNRGSTSTIVGLYLTVSVDGRSVTRTLAGWDPRERELWDPEEQFADPDTGIEPPELAAYAADVRNAFFGGVDIAFEGDGVPYAVAADDYLTANLTRERLAEATIEEDFDGQYEVLLEGYAELPWELMQVMAPLPNAISEAGVTFFDAPRIAMAQIKPTVYPTDDGELRVEKTMDVLPIARCSTATDGGEERFELTLSRSTAIAIAERDAYEVSTASLLEGLEIEPYEDVESTFEEDRTETFEKLFENAGVREDDYHLVAADGSELAFWNVDHTTGAVLGVLDDGTGGGRLFNYGATQSGEDFERFNEVVSELLDILEDKGALSGMGATSLGVVADYYVELAKLYAQVTGLLAGMGDAASAELENDLDEQLREMIKELAENFADEHTSA